MSRVSPARIHPWIPKKAGYLTQWGKAICSILGGLIFIGYDFTFAQSVFENQGNIVYKDQLGRNHQITQSGKDEDPSLSPDGAKIVFLRAGHQIVDRNLPTAGEKVTARQIWIVDARENSEPKLILEGPTRIDNNDFYVPFSPRISPGNDRIYYLVHIAASSQAIVSLTIAGKQVSYVALAMQFTVVPSGKYRGFLIVLQHRAKLGPGYYDWYWLLSPDGAEIGVIGMDQGDVDRFLELYGNPPPK